MRKLLFNKAYSFDGSDVCTQCTAANSQSKTLFQLVVTMATFNGQLSKYQLFLVGATTSS